MSDDLQSNTYKTSEELTRDYFPSLNGLRGISILMVVMAHLRLSWAPFYQLIFNGPLGVSIFFVLSGFLITTICLKEIKLTGGLSLKKFYLRRVLRILPVVLLYIFIVFLADRIFHLHIAYFQYLAALLFVMNFSYYIRNQPTTEFGHFWSLAVEEQFYLIFPFILKKSYKGFSWSIVFIVAVLPLLCLLQEFYKPLNEGVFYMFTHYFIKFQSVAVGCLFSLLAFNKKFDSGWLLRNKTIGNIAAIVVIYYLHFDPFYTIKAVYINLIIAFLIGYVVITNIKPANDFIYKLLNTKVLSLVGTLSYSIYVWQQIFTFGDSKLPAILAIFPYNVVFLTAVACGSYYGYERYFLKLKTRLNKPKASAHTPQ
ncbi:MAG: acyltransferase family protein [Mucilaginibacter sp.]